MSGDAKTGLAALAITHLAVGTAGYMLAPKVLLDSEVRRDGFTVDTTRVLATTVESLRDENKLVVLSMKSTTKVQVDRSWFWLLHGRQELNVPAIVEYRVDMAKLGIRDVTYDKAANQVHVRLPRVTMGDVAFLPEDATTVNGGFLTFSEAQVDALRKLAYVTARKGVTAQAQQPALRKHAERNAVEAIQRNFAMPLAAAGVKGVTVDVTFK